MTIENLIGDDSRIIAETKKGKILAITITIFWGIFLIYSEVMMLILLMDFTYKEVDDLLLLCLGMLGLIIVNLAAKAAVFHCYGDECVITDTHFTYITERYRVAYQIPILEIDKILYDVTSGHGKTNATMRYYILTKTGSLYKGPVIRSINRNFRDKLIEHFSVDRQIAVTLFSQHKRRKHEYKVCNEKHDPEGYVVEKTSFVRKHYLRVYRYFFLLQGSKLLAMWLMSVMSAN